MGPTQISTNADLGGFEGNNRVSVTVGDSSVLTCLIKGQVSMLTWTITPKVGDPCTLVYRIDTNMTDRTNCSDNISWTFRAGLAPALEIQQVKIAQEGNYLCQVASTDGNFCRMYHLTMLAPPRLSLYCDEQDSPMCEAVAGKLPAQLSWVPGSSSTAEEKRQNNRIVTVLSKFTGCSTNVTSVTTCMVSHTAGNWSQSIACCPSAMALWIDLFGNKELSELEACCCSGPQWNSFFFRVTSTLSSDYMGFSSDCGAKTVTGPALCSRRAGNVVCLDLKTSGMICYNFPMDKLEKYGCDKCTVTLMYN
ncbi:cell surface glycoprotein CD200 receptor 1-B-like [Cinclus cinclus]|uniref:cell surface glycoprotein CD200 receptor 1-B-like n=1 Tax=Cinclus cinclus TaxID=127875 RepID=UPI002E0F60CF